jgi:hydroxymethylpyrimidine/phosphomethylpyrimidine kinase
MGKPLDEAISNAKEYLTGALRCKLNLGKGSGPLEHTYVIQ